MIVITAVNPRSARGFAAFLFFIKTAENGQKYLRCLHVACRLVLFSYQIYCLDELLSRLVSVDVIVNILTSVTYYHLDCPFRDTGIV